MENITYDEFINNILETRGRFECGEKYHERHHIVPKCMGGTDDKDNLIDLFAREHFEAHRMLALENPDNEKLVYAWWCMSTMQNDYMERYKITAKEYEELKIQYSQLMQEKMNGSNNPMYNRSWWDEDTPIEKINEWKNNMSNALKEKWLNQDFKEKMCQLRKGKNIGTNNPMYGKEVSKETREKISQASKKCWESPEYRLKMMEHFIGTSNPFYGKHHTDESIYKIRLAKGVPVVQLDKDGNFIAEYICATEASEHTNATSVGIGKCCKGKQNLSGGYKWKYKTDWEAENEEKMEC